MKLNQLRDIVAVAERGSLRAAARHLAVAQPALTRSVRDLERAMTHVRDAGGVVIGPTALPDGRRVAVCEDPQGAAFAMMEPAALSRS